MEMKVPWGKFSSVDIFITLGIILSTSSLTSTYVFYNVTCGSDIMTVTLNVSNHPTSLVYLQNLKGYPGCAPEIHNGYVLFHLNLNETIHCGVSRMLNKRTGHSIYYHRVVIEIPEKSIDVLFVQCIIQGDINMDFVRVDWQKESLPVNYSFDTTSWFNTSNVRAKEMLPYVNMAIRDKRKRLDTSALVKPGSLLDLLIYLEPESSDRYGLSLRYLTLTDDTRSQEEVIVMNGCSVDPYVIQIFRQQNGVLKSQFRAFKFQSSDYVIFLATVNVCMQQCIDVDCYGKADKAGRRRREIPKYLPHYNNEVFEAEITGFLRLEAIDGDIIIEESTNETFDAFYENEYEEDFSEPTAGAAALQTSYALILIILNVILS